MTLVSVIVPLYNEEENVRPLYEELKSVLKPGEFDYEFVFVDDGSTDRTAQALLETVGDDEGVTFVRFRRNFGQTAAMAAGLDHARGDIIATIDGDLQNDPAEIPGMVRKLLNEDLDMIAGWRKNRQDNLWSRTLPSRIGNTVISTITGVHLHDYGCTLKVMTSDVAKSIQLYGEMHRFIPAVAAKYGTRLAEYPVNHRPRIHGTSKYGLSKTFRVILDLLTVKFFLGFATRPLHMFGMVGIIIGAVGGLTSFMLIFQRMFMHMPLANRPLFLLSIMMVLVGLQFLCFGLLAEILVRTYHESQDKKIYTIREIYQTGWKGSEAAPKRVATIS